MFIVTAHGWLDITTYVQLSKLLVVGSHLQFEHWCASRRGGEMVRSAMDPNAVLHADLVIVAADVALLDRQSAIRSISQLRGMYCKRSV